MEKKIYVGIITLLFVFGMSHFFSFAVGDSTNVVVRLFSEEMLPLVSATPTACDSPYELTAGAYGVDTYEKGFLHLPAGTMVGGSPTNFVTTLNDETFTTTAGTIVCQYWTKIDCDHQPYEPDPCSNS